MKDKNYVLVNTLFSELITNFTVEDLIKLNHIKKPYYE